MFATMNNTIEPQEKNEVELISAYEFAERAGVSSTAVYKKVKDGIIEAKKYGKHSLIDWNKFKDTPFKKY